MFMKSRLIPNRPVIMLWLVLLSVYGCAPTKSANGASELELTGTVVSCGHLNIYQLSEDNKSYIQVIINTKKIELQKDNSWNLNEETDGVSVKYREFDDTVASKICNDIGGKRIKPITEVSANEGVISLRLSEDEWLNYKKQRRYKVDLRATGLKLLNDKTYTMSIKQATVGWLPG